MGIYTFCRLLEISRLLNWISLDGAYIGNIRSYWCVLFFLNRCYIEINDKFVYDYLNRKPLSNTLIRIKEDFNNNILDICYISSNSFKLSRVYRFNENQIDRANTSYTSHLIEYIIYCIESLDIFYNVYQTLHQLLTSYDVRHITLL